MGRRACCSKEGLNRGTWTSLEDKILTAYIRAHGEGNWRNLPKRAGLKRCGKSCRLRWLNYLRPDIKRGNISSDEEDLIERLHKLLGNRWSLIAGRLPGRTDNEIKNYWNTTLSKKAKLANESSSSSLPQEAASTTIIRTKARRCTKVVIPFPFPATEEADHQHLQQQQQQQQPINYSAKEDMDFFNSMDGITVTDDPYFGEWDIATICLQDHHNTKLDLDSLAFLLDSTQWPSQQNQS